MQSLYLKFLFGAVLVMLKSYTLIGTFLETLNNYNILQKTITVRMNLNDNFH